MQKHSVFEERFSLTSYDVDFSGRLSLYGLLRRFQELAGAHAEHLHVGYDQLKALGMAWYLSRIKVQIDSLPRWGDNVVLRTWPKGIDRLFAMRDFTLISEGGQFHVAATSRWLMVDTSKGRPVRLETLPWDLKYENITEALPGTLEKIPSRAPCNPVYEREILPSDLDVNYHVNNAEYVKWVVDCFDVPTQSSRALRSIQLNYLEETLVGDRVKIGLAVDQGAESPCYIEGLSTKKGSMLFQAIVEWR